MPLCLYVRSAHVRHLLSTVMLPDAFSPPGWCSRHSDVRLTGQHRQSLACIRCITCILNFSHKSLPDSYFRRNSPSEETSLHIHNRSDPAPDGTELLSHRIRHSRK